MRKIQDLGRRAAALALAAGMTLSVVPGVLAVDADEVLTPPAQTAEQEPETGEPEEPAEEPADSEEEKPAASDAEGGGTELPADSETRRPVVVDPDQLPADSGTETPPVRMPSSRQTPKRNSRQVRTRPVKCPVVTMTMRSIPIQNIIRATATFHSL